MPAPGVPPLDPPVWRDLKLDCGQLHYTRLKIDFLHNRKQGCNFDLALLDSTNGVSSK